jgi:hypothetical protein
VTARELQPCGTPAAWKRHRRNGEDPCDPCKAARRAYNRRWMNNRRTHYPIGECAACHRNRPIQRHRWCEPCVTRWQEAGRPDTGPPPLNLDTRTPGRIAAAAVARSAYSEQAAGRREDYAWLREQGETVAEAARRVGITEVMALRHYEPNRRAVYA